MGFFPIFKSIHSPLQLLLAQILGEMQMNIRKHIKRKLSITVFNSILQLSFKQLQQKLNHVN